MMAITTSNSMSVKPPRREAVCHVRAPPEAVDAFRAENKHRCFSAVLEGVIE